MIISELGQTNAILIAAGDGTVSEVELKYNLIEIKIDSYSN